MKMTAVPDRAFVFEQIISAVLNSVGMGTGIPGASGAGGGSVAVVST